MINSSLTRRSSERLGGTCTVNYMYPKGGFQLLLILFHNTLVLLENIHYSKEESLHIPTYNCQIT